MPLVWAHGEFIKLTLSSSQGVPVDRPRAVWKRYAGERPRPAFQIWRFQQPIPRCDPTKDLFFLVGAEARLHFGRDQWQDVGDLMTEDWGLAHVVVLKAKALAGMARLDFTFFWPRESRWEGQDFHIDIDVHKEAI